MKKLIKITWVLLVGLLMSASAAAYTVVGDEVQDGFGTSAGDYVGYLGNINTGIPLVSPLGTWVSTEWLYANGRYSRNYPTATPDGNDTTHWYSFSSSSESSLTSYFEFGSDLEAFAISFFVDGDDSAFYNRVFTTEEVAVGGMYEYYFANIAAGADILVKIVSRGDGSGSNLSYKVQLFATPLPPAALLFVSALAGFGVIGRKKRYC